MPCNSDHMNAQPKEVLSRETSKLIVYVNGKLGQPVPAYIREAAKDYYGKPEKVDEIVRTLCETITGMSQEQRDAIVYNGKDPVARQLADWWDEHQEADRKRAEAEQRAIAEAYADRVKPHAVEMSVLIADMLSDVPLLGETPYGKRLAEILAEVGPNPQAV